MKEKLIMRILIISLIIVAFTSSPVLAVTYSYDELGRLKSVNYDSGQKTIYSYDSAGNMLSKISSSSAKLITAYSLAAQTGLAVIDSTNHTVSLTVYNGTNVTNLVATFNLSIGATAQVGSTAQVSGTTANDFTNSVIYKVTAADGSEQDWMVTVIVAAPISETLTVGNPSTTGFTVALSPALNRLTTSDFTLMDGSTPAAISLASTTDNGATYTIAATLTAGKTYTITAAKTGYDFGTAQNVVVPAATYTVTYNGNGSTSGTVPVDNTSYVQGASVTVLDNTGYMVKTGYTFAGWNTVADGSGTSYAPGVIFMIGTANVTLYAQWTANPAYSITFTVTDGSTNIQGATVTLGSLNATTDTNGQASFNLENGTYSYTVNAAGMQNASGSVTVNGAAITQTVTMSPQA